MDIPVSIAINKLASSKAEFSICRFKDNKHSVDAPPHYHIVISLDDGISLVLCIITSQMQKLGRRYINSDHPQCVDSLVPLDQTKFSCITKPCIIDCNQTEIFSIKELAKRIDNSKIEFSFEALNNDFGNDLKVQILDAICNSNIVREIIKKRIKKTFTFLYP